MGELKRSAGASRENAARAERVTGAGGTFHGGERNYQCLMPCGLLMLAITDTSHVGISSPLRSTSACLVRQFIVGGAVDSF